MRVLPPTGHLLPPNHFRFLGLQGSVSRISLSMTADSPIVHAKTQRAFVETRNAGRDMAMNPSRGGSSRRRWRCGCRRGERAAEAMTAKEDGDFADICEYAPATCFAPPQRCPQCHATSSNEFGSTDAKGQNFRRLMVEVARPGESKPAGRWRKQQGMTHAHELYLFNAPLHSTRFKHTSLPIGRQGNYK
jgi:hypothetical protein